VKKPERIPAFEEKALEKRLDTSWEEGVDSFLKSIIKATRGSVLSFVWKASILGGKVGMSAIIQSIVKWLTSRTTSEVSPFTFI